MFERITKRPIIVLDAMGVIYRSADDVAELLIPFVLRHNPAVAEALVRNCYQLASLGHLGSDQFWDRLGVPASLENDFLAGHGLQAGLHEFLDWAETSGFRLACLSNDVSRWSSKLRQRFELEDRFEKWIISGDVGVRKPDPAIYQALLRELDASPSRLLFVDDRLANVQAAQALGIQSILFGGQALEHCLVPSCAEFPALRHRVEVAFGEVSQRLCGPADGHTEPHK